MDFRYERTFCRPPRRTVLAADCSPEEETFVLGLWRIARGLPVGRRRVHVVGRVLSTPCPAHGVHHHLIQIDVMS